MQPTTFDELHKAVEKGEIVSAIDKAGKKKRLFVATNGLLCFFKKGSSRRGFSISANDFDNFVSFQTPAAPLTEEKSLKKQYREIVKYKEMAGKATFTSSFIEDCKNIPSFEEWKQEKKGLYKLGITTGNKIDGKVISINRIAKQYPHYAQMLREAIANKSEATICSRVPFAGYEMTISTAKRNDEFLGYCSIEYKNCGNGYYYLLINDENFIGYDVD